LNAGRNRRWLACRDGIQAQKAQAVAGPGAKVTGVHLARFAEFWCAPAGTSTA